MNKLIILSVSALIAFYTGQASASCPFNKGKEVKTNPGAQKDAEQRALACLKETQKKASAKLSKTKGIK